MKMNIKCDTYRKFRKIIRKYSKKYWRRLTRPWFWAPWISYRVDSLKKIEEIKKTREYQKESVNLPIIIKELEENFNQLCKFDTGCNGYLKGIEITNEDYYYVFDREDNGKESFQSCVGGFERVDEK